MYKDDFYVIFCMFASFFFYTFNLQALRVRINNKKMYKESNIEKKPNKFITLTIKIEYISQ